MFLRLIGLVIILFLFAAPCMAEPLDIAISSLAAEDSPEVLATEYLKKLIEERSSGRMLVTIETSNTQHTDILKALSKQQIQFALLNIRDLQQTLPMLQICELPFLFRDRKHLHRSLDNEMGSRVLQASQKQQLTPLALWDGPAQQLLLDTGKTDNKKALRQLIAFQLAEKKQMSHPENHWQETSLQEATKRKDWHHMNVLIRTDHRFSLSILLAQQSFWQALPADIRVIIEGAIRDASLYNQELAEQLDIKSLESLYDDQNLEVRTLSAKQKMDWRTLSRKNLEGTQEQKYLDFIDMITGQLKK